MNFELSQEHQQLQKSAIDFARSELNDDIIARDRCGSFPREGWEKCGRFGVLGLPIPTEYGGLGLDITSVIVVMEGLGYACRDQGLLFSLNAHLWTSSMPILEFGTDEQRRKYLPGLCSGDHIAANGASEAEAGSDVFAMRTSAQRKGNCYVLNGSKTFVTNAPVADLFVIYATVNPELGPLGITAFIVERDSPGLTISGHLQKMGLRTSPMAEVVFDNCMIPVANRLGREGRGVELFEASLEWERGCILANYLGVMKRHLELCIEHARRRKQFGRPIGHFQSVSSRIVNMKVRLETCRPLIYRIGWLKDRGKSARLEASIAKLYVSESLVQSSLDAVQIHGGYGYMVEAEFERELRDAVGSTLYSGTSEIQREIISKSLGL